MMCATLTDPWWEGSPLSLRLGGMSGRRAHGVPTFPRYDSFGAMGKPGAMLDRLKFVSGRWTSRTLLDVLTVAGLLFIVLGTGHATDQADQRLILAAIMAIWACISVEFLVKLYRARAKGGPLRYLGSTEGLIGLASVLALPAGWLLASDPTDISLYGLIWSLRYIRGDSGLAIFGRVIERSRKALLSLAGAFVVIFLISSTLAYLFERSLQPETFGSIPETMWWAIVTLTTTGYGHEVPVTIWGRLLAGWVMIGGTVMIALQAGVIATAFGEELRRRHFLRTWDLVVSVPFFQSLGAAAIADIVRLLEVRDVTAGTVIVRAGDPGDAMYFIVSGEMSVELPHGPVILDPGGFFGEMSLLFGTPRSADVVATKSSVLLVLDIADFRELAGRRPEIVEAIEAEGVRRRAENAARSAKGS